MATAAEDFQFTSVSTSGRPNVLHPTTHSQTETY